MRTKSSLVFLRSFAGVPKTRNRCATRGTRGSEGKQRGMGHPHVNFGSKLERARSLSPEGHSVPRTDWKLIGRSFTRGERRRAFSSLPDQSNPNGDLQHQNVDKWEGIWGGGLVASACKCLLGLCPPPFPPLNARGFFYQSGAFDYFLSVLLKRPDDKKNFVLLSVAPLSLKIKRLLIGLSEMPVMWR